jgi:hypothetical protein
VSSLHRSHSQDWSLQGLQNPVCANDSRRTSSISSVSSGVPQNAFTPQPYVQQHSSASKVSVRPVSFDKTSPNPYQGSSTEARVFSPVSRDDRTQRHQAETSKHETKEEQAEESWWEELRALDYSEGSNDSKHFGKSLYYLICRLLDIQTLSLVTHPANPVAEPLPCTMRDEDLVARLPIAASVPAGTPVSKYFRNLNVEDFMQNSLDYFKGEIGVDDPAFAVLKDKCEAVSTEELIGRRQNIAVVAAKGNGGDEELQEHDLQESADSDEVREFEESCGHTGDGLPTPCQSQESEEERLAREQEEKLAALGVTGFAKPVRTSVRRSIIPATPAYSESQGTPAEYNSTLGPAAQGLPSRYSDEKTAKAAYSNGLSRRPQQPSNDAAWEGYRTSGSPTGSHHHATSLQTPPMSACHDSRSDNNGNCARRFSNNDAQSTMSKSPTTAKDMLFVASSLAVPDSTPGNRGDENVQPRSITASLAMGYDKNRSLGNDHSGQALSRKRSTREFSAEVDEGPKRQKDEGHQREKRSAPKVAAAYRSVSFRLSDVLLFAF